MNSELYGILQYRIDVVEASQHSIFFLGTVCAYKTLRGSAMGHSKAVELPLIKVRITATS